RPHLCDMTSHNGVEHDAPRLAAVVGAGDKATLHVRRGVARAGEPELTGVDGGELRLSGAASVDRCQRRPVPATIGGRDDVVPFRAHSLREHDQVLVINGDYPWPFVLAQE